MSTVGLASLAADIETDLALTIELSSMVFLVGLGIFSGDLPAVLDHLLVGFSFLLALLGGLFVQFGGLPALFRWLLALFGGLPALLGGQTTEKMHAKCERIIKADERGDLSRYAARAIPNHHLELAFHVNNCFTAKKADRCATFRAHVLKLLQPAASEDKKYWPDLVRTARRVAISELSGPGNEVNLFDAVQMTAMKTMFRVLFPELLETTSKDQHIRTLAKEVNQQWLASKGKLVPDVTPGWEFEQQGSLKAAAEAIFGKWDEGNLENPFNKILPGYETMWRVVLRCIIELMSARHPIHKAAWKELLNKFIQTPTRDQLEEKNDKGLTAEHVSFEVLRLYPPTRHVARESGGQGILTADIEKLHHTAPVWNPDPKTFRSERWTTLSGMNTKGFMPFACDPFICPAKQHNVNTKGIVTPFGVTMIAVLTGCFVEAMGSNWCLKGEGIPAADKLIGNLREDCSTVTLYRLGSDKDVHATGATGKDAANKTGAAKTGAKEEGK